MGYATVSHVQALSALRTFTASSAPNASQVSGFLDETAAVIDALLAGQGYGLPIATTATSALKLLELYNAQGAWARVEAAAPNSPNLDRAEKAWEAAQKMLADGTVDLVGVDRSTTLLEARMSSVATPYFSREMDL